MPHERAVGIDLGTTFSAVAWVDESGQTAMIRNAEGDLLTPSVVLFSDKEVVVGKEARTRHDGPARSGGRVGQARHGPALLHAGRSTARSCRRK